jgi:hypothetical protein
MTTQIPAAVAQDFSPSVGISIVMKSSDRSDIKTGLIVAKDPEEHYLTRSYQDPNIAGVIAEKTDFLYTTGATSGRTTIAIDGVARVWVSNAYGPIKYGDYLTTSTQAGVGVKALENGSVIGYALEVPPEGAEPHLINVQLAISDSWTGVTGDENALTQSGNTLSRVFANIEREASQSSNSFMYVIVIVILISASIFGFLTFGKIAVNGINAMGRNPLAKAAIIKTILINSFITLLFTLGSLMIVFFLLR